jgi:DNA-binding protein HU-beta
MKKSDFIAAVAKEAGVTRVQADKVVNAALSVISNTLKSGDKVTLTGFGTFEVRNRAERAGMNIRTGEKIRIPASKRPVFSAGAVLRGSISGKAGGKNGKAKGKAAAKNGKAKTARR